MKLLIKQRVFSWTDTYDIYDEDGKPKYFVKAELFRLGHQLHVYDSANREIGMVKQRIFTFLPVFDIEIDGQTFGSIEKQFLGAVVSHYHLGRDLRWYRYPYRGSPNRNLLCYRSRSFCLSDLKTERPASFVRGSCENYSSDASGIGHGCCFFQNSFFATGFGCGTFPCGRTGP